MAVRRAQLSADRSSKNSNLVCRITEGELYQVIEDAAQPESFWHCQPAVVMDDGIVTLSTLFYRIELDPQIVQDYRYRLASRQLFVEIIGGRLSEDDDDAVGEPRVILPETNNTENMPTMVVVDPPVQSLDDPSSTHRAVGTRTLTLIRISIADATPTLSSLRLHELLFRKNEISLTSQFSKCSHGELTIVPTTNLAGMTQPGIVDVRLADYQTQVNDRNSIINAALSEVDRQLALTTSGNGNGGGSLFQAGGGSSIFDVSHLVMVVVPPGVDGFAAYAHVNGQLSVYNDLWVGYLGAQMHELGHNFGLGHAWKDGTQYLGMTGHMGGASQTRDYPAPVTQQFPQSCFNGHNNWHLGWYGRGTIEAKPVGRPQLFRLVALTDWGNDDNNNNNNDNDAGGFVVVKVGDYYLQYNRAKLFNRQTGDGANALSIVHEFRPMATDLVATLPPPSDGALRRSAPLLLPGTNFAVQVCQKYINRSDLPDYLLVSIGRNGQPSACPPIVPPTTTTTTTTTTTRTTTTAATTTAARAQSTTTTRATSTTTVRAPPPTPWPSSRPTEAPSRNPTTRFPSAAPTPWPVERNPPSPTTPEVFSPTYSDVHIQPTFPPLSLIGTAEPTYQYELSSSTPTTASANGILAPYSKKVTPTVTVLLALFISFLIVGICLAGLWWRGIVRRRHRQRLKSVLSFNHNDEEARNGAVVKRIVGMAWGRRQSESTEGCSMTDTSDRTLSHRGDDDSCYVSSQFLSVPMDELPPPQSSSSSSSLPHTNFTSSVWGALRRVMVARDDKEESPLPNNATDDELLALPVNGGTASLRPPHPSNRTNPPVWKFDPSVLWSSAMATKQTTPRPPATRFSPNRYLRFRTPPVGGAFLVADDDDQEQKSNATTS